MMSDGFVTVTKGHRLCAKNKKKGKERGGHAEEGYIKSVSETGGGDMLYKRILQRKYIIVMMIYF